MSHWLHYDHEADIGIEGMGANKEAAFSQAALALTALITDPGNISHNSRIEITCEAPNDEILFVDWLNALIYEMANQKMLFGRFDIEINAKESTHSLYASVWGEKIDQAKHQPAVEIKGATFTTLQVYEDENHIWHAKTVVDV